MRYKKSLGQHILNDSSIARFMVESANVGDGDTVLEVGPGTGVVTLELLEKAGKVVAVEFDRRMVDVLKRKFGKEVLNSKFEIREQDILRFLDEKEEFIFQEPFKVVASLPYNVGTPILRKLTEGGSCPEVIVVLIQYEVAQRICSTDGKGSILGNAIQYYAKAEILKKVGPEKFDPPPKVDSAVLRIKNIKKRDPEEEKKFFRLMKFGFASKRRTLVNNLSTGFPQMSKEEIGDILEKNGLGRMVRAEELEVEDWLGLIPFFFK